MNITRCLLSLFLVVSWFCGLGPAQEGSSAAAPVVPRLVNFAGKATDVQGKAISGMVGVSFAIYKDQYEGAPLWMETQNVQADAKGNYTVQLGATKAQGLPVELFISGEARWLGVRVNGGEEQPRVLLLSVPYALKAADAETVGGLPPSAFLLATPFSPGSSGSTSSGAVSSSNPLAPLALTGGGAVNTLPIWTTATNLGNSRITQIGGVVSVADHLQLPSTGTATATKGFNSQPMALLASSFNKTIATAVNQHFRWQAEPVGNNTASPSAKLNLLFAPGAATPAETGLSISNNGIINFAAGQTLPKVSGNETVTGNLSASQLVSTVASGTPPLKVTSTTQVANLNATLLGGFSASAFQPAGAYASLQANNFTGNQNVTGNVSVSASVGIGTSTPTERLDLGNQGNVVITTDPGNDTAEGNVAYKLVGRDSGGGTRTWAIFTAPIGGGFGVPANSLSVWEYPSSGAPGCCMERFTILPAPAREVPPAVTIDELGNILTGPGGSVFTREVFASGDVQAFGFVTAGYDVQAAGCVMASGNVLGGTCKSDARLKKNVQLFAPVLDKVVQLQPVSYRWRADEYPQFRFASSKVFGLIAQDVEKVFPEMVSVDKDGFKNVNYSGLPYLMLQAIRELKTENDSLREQLKAEEKQIQHLAARSQDREDERSELAQLRAEVERLAAMVKTNTEAPVQASVSAAHR